MKKECYCSISILNHDAFFPTILATRLNAIIVQYIQKDQEDFIRGQSISENVRRTINLINSAKNRPEALIILSLDTERGRSYQIALAVPQNVMLRQRARQAT